MFWVKRNKSNHGNLIRPVMRNVTRELCPDYLKDRSKSQVIQTLSSIFIRKLFAEKLATIRRPKVLFSAGGPGSGKSTVLNTHSGMAALSGSADIIYDTTMSNYPSARAMVEQVLHAGGVVRVALIIRDPLEAVQKGAIERAVDQELKHGSGRTVPLDYLLKAHPASIQTVFRLAEECKDNPEVKFRFMDNTHGKENISEVSLEQAQKIEFKDVEARAWALLEKEYLDGRISKKIYTGFKFGGDEP
jgi:energy-coupling factor transporter ATP-binding protein EcfA2